MYRHLFLFVVAIVHVMDGTHRIQRAEYVVFKTSDSGGDIETVDGDTDRIPQPGVVGQVGQVTLDADCSGLKNYQIQGQSGHYKGVSIGTYHERFVVKQCKYDGRCTKRNCPFGHSKKSQPRQEQPRQPRQGPPREPRQEQQKKESPKSPASRVLDTKESSGASGKEPSLAVGSLMLILYQLFWGNVVL